MMADFLWSYKKRQMKKMLVLLMTSVLAVSCDKECGKEDLSTCLQQKVELYKNDATENPCPNYGIKEYRFEGNRVYVFGSPGCIADGVDIVLNARCDTICNLGGLIGNINCSSKIFYDHAVFIRDIWKP
jgi:hypothetical protein